MNGLSGQEIQSRETMVSYLSGCYNIEALQKQPIDIIRCLYMKVSRIREEPVLLAQSLDGLTMDVILRDEYERIKHNTAKTLL